MCVAKKHIFLNMASKLTPHLTFDHLTLIINFLDEFDVALCIILVNKLWSAAGMNKLYWRDAIARNSWSIIGDENLFQRCLECMRLWSKPCYRGDCQRSFYFSGQPPSRPLGVSWTMDLDGLCKNSLIAYQSRVFICQEEVGIHCIDLYTGQNHWIHESNSSETDVLEYCVIEKKLISIVGTEKVIAINDEGIEIWKYELEDVNRVSQFVVRQGTIIYLSSTESTADVTALSLETGLVLWRSGLPPSIRLIPPHLASDGTVIVSPVCEGDGEVSLLVLSFDNFHKPPLRQDIIPLHISGYLTCLMLHRKVAIACFGGDNSDFVGVHVSVDMNAGAEDGQQGEVTELYSCDSGAFASIDKSSGLLYVMNGYAGGGGAFDVDFKGISLKTLQKVSESNPDVSETETDIDPALYGDRYSLSLYGHLFGPLIVSSSGVHSVEMLWGDGGPLEFITLDTKHGASLPVQSWRPMDGMEYCVEDFEDSGYYILHKKSIVFADPQLLCVFTEKAAEK
jgi:hypothetical protein